VATAELIHESETAVPSAWALPRQIPELDGIRGVAILLVLICHSTLWLPASVARDLFEQGKIGVDLFFVLSGFLITGILLDSQGRPRALRNFYVRRGLRIWPLYFAYLATAFLLFRRMLPAHFSAAAYAVLAQNFFYWTSMGPFLEPTWSLAVEEQFYVVWPWIALHVKRQAVLKIGCAVLAIAPLVRLGFRMAGAGAPFIYANTLCRLDGIAMGAVIAAWVRGRDFAPGALLRFVRASLPLGVAGTAFCYAAEGWMRFATELRYSFVTLAFGGVLAAALLLQGTDSPFARTLRNPSLTGLGRISFALYLFNLPIYGVAHGRLAGRLLAGVPEALAGAAVLLVSNGVLLASAACSWRFFESPILRLKSRLAAERPNIITTVVTFVAPEMIE